MYFIVHAAFVRIKLMMMMMMTMIIHYSILCPCPVRSRGMQACSVNIWLAVLTDWLDWARFNVPLDTF